MRGVAQACPDLMVRARQHVVGAKVARDGDRVFPVSPGFEPVAAYPRVEPLQSRGFGRASMESRLQIARDCFVIQDLPFREVLSTDFQRPLLAAVRLPTSVHLSRIGVRCTTDSSHSNLE